jgi:Fur family ferric uptake transcriptional regulator
MRKHKDLLAVLRHNSQRVTPARQILLQFLIDNYSRSLSLPEIQAHLQDRLPGINRSSIYRNLEMLKTLSIIQELRNSHKDRRFQFTFERPVHNFIICKACGKVIKGKRKFFEEVERALQAIGDFKKKELSITFYGFCSPCRNS